MTATFDDTVTIPADSTLAARATLDADIFDDADLDADEIEAVAAFDTVEALDLASPDTLIVPLAPAVLAELAEHHGDELSRWLTAYARTVATYNLESVAHLFAQPSIDPGAIAALAAGETPPGLDSQSAEGLGRLLAAAALGMLRNRDAEHFTETHLDVDPVVQQWHTLTVGDGPARYAFTVQRVDGVTPLSLAVTFAEAITAWRETDKALAVDTSDEAHAAHAAACDELAEIADGPAAHLLDGHDATPPSPAELAVTELAGWFAEHPHLIGAGSAVDNAVALLTLAYGDSDEPVDMSRVAPVVCTPTFLADVADTFIGYADQALEHAAAQQPPAPTPHNLFDAACGRRRDSDPTMSGATCPACQPAAGQ